MQPRIAVLSFPGNNCEVESLRAVRLAGMEPLYFRWNDDRGKLEGVDGYFLPGGFSYEDRGRSGMVAARDPLLEFIGREAAAGKAVVGNCNGAQILVESGIIPLGDGLRMSLARNAVSSADGVRSPGFLSQWVWMTPSCTPDRCATSAWSGPMHLPIAHGEGRFVTTDPELVIRLSERDQIAFRYCDERGEVSAHPAVTPNGSTDAIAGICSPEGNVVAVMPHPECTPLGLPYFESMKRWIERGGKSLSTPAGRAQTAWDLPARGPRGTEVFIDTIIVNNEERTVEQTARRFVPGLRLKQWKYLSLASDKPGVVLRNLSHFNPNKERAYLRRGAAVTRWNSDAKREERISPRDAEALFRGTALLRRDVPDTGAAGLGADAQTGVCYVCADADERQILVPASLEVFANPHASTLEQMTF